MNKQGVMERLIWYQELRKIFDAICEQNNAPKSRLLAMLNDSLLKLPLKSSKDYELSTIIQGFSFEDVYNHIQSMPRYIKWDELLDSLGYLGIYTKGSIIKNEVINLVQIKSESRQEEVKNNDKGTLKEDFPDVKFHNLREIDIGKNLKFLSIGGNLIANAAYEFPSSLIALNLSYNIITEFLPQKPLSNLKFLNLSHNLIDNLPDISSIITLNELFLFGNKLKSANFLFSIKNMCLLDIGSNLLDNFEDLAMLSVSTRLHTLNLVGNPLYLKSGYKTSISQLFPRLIYMDPEDISIHSKYQQIGFSIDNNKSLQPIIEKNDPLNCSKIDLNPTMNTLDQHQSSVLSTDYNLSPNNRSCSRSLTMAHRVSTPSRPKQSDSRHNRSRSQAGTGSEPTTPSLNNTCKVSSHKRSKSILTENKSSTCKPNIKTFGNPITAMMIGPPAVKNIFKVPSRKTRNISIDISKFKK